MTPQHSARQADKAITDTSSDERLLSASLCSNCANMDSCGSFSAAESAVLQCELYECCSSVKPELVGAGESSTTTNEDPMSVHFMGLCSNCDNRSDCKLPKPQAGVWHCEEYA
jgi:hypothetical protein